MLVPKRNRALLGILAAGLLVNSLWLFLHPPALTSGETSHWWPIILNVAHGKGFVGCFPEYFPFCGAKNQVTAAREPVPVVLFAGMERLAGDSFRAASVLEILFDLAITVALFYFVREVAGRRMVWLAALLWVFYLPALKLIPQVSGDLEGALGLTAGIFFFTRAERTGSRRDAVWSGVSLGLGTLSRSVAMVAVPILVTGALLGRTRPLRDRVRLLNILLSAFFAVLLPWAARNYHDFGSPVVTSTMTGYNLFRHNSILPRRDYLRYVAGDEGGAEVADLVARRSDLRGTENEAQMDTVYREEAEGIILARPWRYLRLCAYRFLPLWFDWGVLQAYGARPRPQDYLVMGEQALLLVLAGWGVWRLRLRGWAVAGTIAGVTLAQMAVVGQLRYIVPVMPLVLVLVAAGLAPRADIASEPPSVPVP